MLERVLIIGATGMLGRPVARRLVREGFAVRAMVRDAARARTLLPSVCELTPGDVRDAAALDDAMRGVDAVYTNFANPFSPRTSFDPDRDGTPLIVEAARRHRVRRLMRISAMGVPDAAAEWWLIDRKRITDELVARSGVPFTIFRPTWLMESVPLFMMGRLMVRITTPNKPLWWLAGDDYARGVAAALRSDRAETRTYVMQGPEPLTVRDVTARFVAAWPRRLLTLPMPRAMLKLMRLINAQAGYLDDLLTMTFRHTSVFRADEAWADLGRPTMFIEEYARSIDETGDLPQK